MGILVTRALWQYVANPTEMKFPPTFWKDFFEKYPPLGLPTSPTTLPSKCVIKHISMPQNFKEKLRQLSRELRVRQTALCMCAFLRTMKEIIGKSDGSIILVFNGRSFPPAWKKLLPGNPEEISESVINTPILYIAHVSLTEFQSEVENLQKISNQLSHFSSDGIYDFFATSMVSNVLPNTSLISFNNLPVETTDVVSKILRECPVDLCDRYRYSYRTSPSFRFKFILGSAGLYAHYDQQIFSENTAEQALFTFKQELIKVFARASEEAKL